MADLRAWRNAAHELPPDGVPVLMMDGDGTVSIFETFRDEDGAACWAVCEYAPWWTGLALNPSWHSVSAYYEGDRVARYWHPLPDVPTLAELDAHRDERATDAATAAASEGGGAVRLTIGQRIQAAGFAYGRALVEPDVSLIAQDDAWCRLLQRAAEVDALLARIRAALTAEREAAWEAVCWADDYDSARATEAVKARAALDALLGGEE